MSESYVYTIQHESKSVGLTESFGDRGRCLAIITRDEWSAVVADADEEFRLLAKAAGVGHVRLKRRSDMTVERIFARQLCTLFWGVQGAGDPADVARRWRALDGAARGWLFFMGAADGADAFLARTPWRTAIRAGLGGCV